MSAPQSTKQKTTPIAQLITRACEEERAGQAYGALSATIKREFAQAQSRAFTANPQGDLVARKLSDFMTSALAAIFKEARAAHPQAGKKVALVAVGGFGRERLAPKSDIDLLFLHQFRDENKIKPLLDFILYALWDAGFVVGQSVHTPKSAVAFSREDIVARTAFLDARLMAGEEAVFDEFKDRFSRLRATTKKKFIAAKRAEQTERHDLAEQSRYLAEPDVKEGRGGLRDLHTIGWLYHYVHGHYITDKEQSGKLLDPADVRAFKKAVRFLWSIRVHLHAIVGRAHERLTFELQPQLAERLGYSDRSNASAAERLMKHYFVNAREVGRLSRLFRARLDASMDSRLLAPRALPKRLQTDEIEGEPNLKLSGGRLDFKNAAQAIKTPLDFFRLFRAFAKKPDLEISPDALALVAAHVKNINQSVRNDPYVAQIFLASLVKARRPAEMLRIMGEVGLLAKYLPFFGVISGRIEYSLYRRFALDEQVFQAIGFLADLKRGDEVQEHPVVSACLASYRDLTPFYLSVLLYEARHARDDQTPQEISRRVRRILSRLGVYKDDVEDIVFAVTHHDAMITLAERRSLSERRVLKRFADMVGTKKRLDLLLTVTVCHLRVVNENAWSDWDRRQLKELYFSAAAYMEGGDEGLEAWLKAGADNVRADAAQRLSAWPSEERERFLASISDEMARSLDAAQLARFARLYRGARGVSAGAGVDAHFSNGFVEAIVLADDRPGLLADLAGAVYGAGASLRSVEVLSAPDGRALDFFTIKPGGEGMEDDPNLARRLHEALLNVASGEALRPPALGKKLGDRRSIFTVTPAVRLDLDASDDCLVVEAEGRDRPGLLYKLASALSEIGVEIKAAHISTFGERAVDAFYLQDAPGYKITNKRRLQSIERRLLNVLATDIE